jgi:TolB-like protein/Flp pilus assembly protein TadD/class 3 adenylate cyclase
MNPNPMPPEPSSEVKFEIGHVLFIDIVGYSKLLIHEQSEELQKLKELVRGTEQFRLAEAEGKLLRLPTGDGGALVFRNTQEAPVLCALEISKALKNYPELRVRMGIHSGPVNEVADLNEQMNAAGAGINTARRVMDCGDAGHILLSKHVAEDLEDYARWRPYLHELGECETKHGAVISVVNLYDDEVGNPQLPEKLKEAQRERAAKVTAGRPAATFRRKHLLFAAAALLTGVAAIGFWIYSRQAPVTPSSLAKSIAVLPFENLSRDPDNAYFAEGIKEEILARLSKVGTLKVVSIRSTEQTKSSLTDLSQMAQKLGVGTFLEGSVQRSADEVRVTVQLVKAQTDTHLWADTFDRKLTDIFAVESEIAKTIAETLQANLSGSEEHAIAARPTENTEAHQLYLKGRYFWNRRTGENLKKSIDYFNQAIVADPNYALAYVGLADCYVLLEEYAGTPSSETLPKARAAALHALQIDDSLAEAHTSLGLINLSSWQFGKAEKEYKRGIELNPNYPTAHHFYSGYLHLLGRLDEAMAEVKRAQQLDPLSRVISDNLVVIYFFKGDLNAGIEQCKKNIELDPNYPRAHSHLGWAYLKQGREQEAMTELQKAVEVSGRGSQELGYLGYAYGALGKRAEATAVLSELEERYARRESPALYLAAVYAGLGENDQAFACLERDFQARTGMLTYITVRPVYDTLRSDPRYTDLLGRMGLKR